MISALIGVFRKFIPVCICLGLLGGCASSSFHSVDEQLEGLAQEGEDAYRRGYYEKAQTLWRQGLEMARQHQRNRATAGFIIELARVDESRGRYDQALARAEGGLAMARAGEDKALEADAHVVLGLVHRHIENYAQARSHSITAQGLAHQIGDQGLESESLRNIGAIYQEQGDYETALSYYGQSLDLALVAGDRIRQAMALNNMGIVRQLLGEYPKALEYYGQSLALRKQLGDLAGRGKVLGNICMVHIQFNQPEQAMDYCTQALEIARRTDDQAREANSLNNIAAIYRQRGEYRQALSYFKRAARVSGELGDNEGEARSLNNIGEIYLLQRKQGKALEYFSHSLRIKEKIGDKPGQSTTRYNIGLLHFQLGQYQQALEHLERSLVLQMEIGEPDMIWRILHDLSRTHAALSHLDLAIFLGKQAVNTLQSVRTRIQDMEKALQRSYLEDKRRAYKHLTNLLIDEGRLLEAQQVMAMLKEEEYFDFIRSHTGEDPRAIKSSFSRAEKPLMERYNGIHRDIARFGAWYSILDDILESAMIELSPKEQAVVEALKDELEAAKLTERAQPDLRKRQRSALLKVLGPERSDLSKEERNSLERLKQEIKAELNRTRIAFREFMDELDEHFYQLGRERYRELVAETEDLADFRDDLKELGHGAVLVHFWITEEKLRIIVTGPDLLVRPIAVDSHITRKELNRLISEYRQAIEGRGDTLPVAQKLYGYLFAPIENDLRGFGAKTLMVYLDESLRYLPLAALHDGKGYVGERYAVVMYAAAAREELGRVPQSAAWQVAGFGVTKEVKVAGITFNALPGVEDELNGIVRKDESDPRGVLPGQIYLNEDFTGEQLENAIEEGGFPILHLATHFRFQPGTLEDSFLLLGNGERLSMADFYDIIFDQLATTDLLALSACETAVGGEDADGREVESLGTMALEKGVGAVLATLWKVEDRSTAIFMERFYAYKRMHGSTKAEAIRRTQLAFIRGHPEDIPVDAQDRGEVLGFDLPLEDRDGEPKSYAHPYYWAPFILMGNWL